MRKVIHYCWFGRNPKSQLILDCMNSWRKYMPDYEIIEWNESNFDVTCCEYVKEAYEAKKWAFVSDYARCAILNEYGGLYFDTDVELLKPLDGLLSLPLVALEDEHSINTGLIMYCEPHNDFCKWMLESYHSDRFILQDGSYNLYTVCQRGTDYFRLHGFEDRNEMQYVAGYAIYPTEYFCPYRYGQEPLFTEKTYAFHHYAASWLPPKIKVKRKIQKFLGKKLTACVVKVKAFLKKRGQ